MQNVFQQTISDEVSFNGIGLHSGKLSIVKLIPAKPNHGIVFKRIDLPNKNIIEASFENVTSAKLCTTLENSSGSRVSTVEHLLAAFYILGIDNVLVEINNEEVPIMDGSSKDFIKILKSVGTKKQNSKRRYLKVLKKVELEDNGRVITIEPYNDSLEVNFQLNYSNKIIGNQKNTVDFADEDLSDIYSSRTFCLYEDIEKIKKSGLAKGGSLDNAIVVNQNEIVNKNGLRNKKEFVNHKILDLAGDFLLSGFRILGKVKCHQGGHQLSNLFLRKLLKMTSAFKLEEIDKQDIRIAKKADINRTIKLAVNA